jgi:uncharacterized protein (DUF2147 family)
MVQRPSSDSNFKGRNFRPANGKQFEIEVSGDGTQSLPFQNGPRFSAEQVAELRC